MVGRIKERNASVVFLIELQSKIFKIIFPLTLVITTIWGAWGTKETFSYEKTDQDTTVTEQPKQCWEKRIDWLLIGSLIVLLIIGIVALWTSLSEYIWIFTVVSIPLYLEYITGAYVSVNILGNVIKENSHDKLSTREKKAIEIIAFVIWYLGNTNLYNWVEKIIIQCQNIMLSDALLAFLYIIVLLVYTFFILALLPTPLFCGIKFLRFIGKNFPRKKQLETFGNWLIEHINSPVKTKPILVHAIIYAKERNQRITRYLIYLLLPAVYLIDIIKLIISFICAFFVSTVGYLVLLFRLIKTSVKRFFLWILNLSDKRIVAVSFRVALIFAFISVVAMNRYQPFFREYEKSTAVFEFLASSIIIPIIFEWISSARKFK